MEMQVRAATLLFDFLTVDALHAASEAKVAYLNGAVVVDQNIARLEVSVDYFGLVEVVETAQNVVHDRFDLSFLQVLARLDQFFQVHVTLAQHQVYFIEFHVHQGRLRIIQYICWRQNGQQSVAARVGHRLENCHFAKEPPCALLVAKHMLVALAGVLTLRVHVQNLHDSTVGPLAKLFHQLEIRRQLEVLVQIVKAETELVFA